MNTPVDNPIFLARQQEQQKLPKILACGIGGSLVFHGITAIAFNYLPQQAPVPIEVTLIDPSEIPADLKPRPSPTITPPLKVKPTPAPVAKTKPTAIPTPFVRVTPTPIPTPSVKVTPTPIPTPSVKVTPTPIPTPSVKITPTPQIVKIVTKPVESVMPVQEMPKKLTSNDFRQQQKLASVPFQKNNDRQSQTDPVTQPNKINNADSAQRALRDQNDAGSPNSKAPGNHGTGTGSSGNSQPLIAGRTSSQSFDRFDGNSGSSGSPAGGEGDATSSNSSPGGSGSRSDGSSGIDGQSINSQFLAAGRTGGRLTGLTGNGSSNSGGDGDSFGIVLIPGSSGGGSQSNFGGTGGIGSNGSSLASGRTGKPGDSFINGGGISGDGYGDGDGSATALTPGGSGGGSRSSFGGTGGTGGNGSSLTAHRTGKPGSGFGNGSGAGGDGDGLSQDVAPGTNISRSGGVIQTSKGFGSGLECLANCQPSYPPEVEYEAIVGVIITLDNSGQVIATKLFKPSKNRDLNSFAQTAFGKMQFRLPASVANRNFLVQMKFKETH